MTHTFLRAILLPLFLLTAAIISVSGFVSAQGNAAVAKIGVMHVEGAHVISADKFIAATGLKAGDRFDPNRLNVVMQKLGKSGVFSDLTYTYLPQGAVVKIDFKVEEAQFRPCVFDNFVWLGKDEIDSYLRKDLPLYAGVLPETGDLLDDVAASLERLSQEKGIKIHVVRRVQQQAIGDKDWTHAFVAEGVKIPVRAVNLSGAITIDPNELQKETSLLVGREYSAFGTALFGSKTIAPFFADRGYLRATVAPPVVKVLEHTDGTAEFPVEITYLVTEGSLYHWQPAEWTGDQLIASKDLDALTGMKISDVANAKRIADGWTAIKEAYARQGYIDAKLSADPNLDDTKLQVHYRVTTTAGPQYRMGKFSIIGLPPKLEEQLKARWNLESGKVFDSDYVKDFVKKEFIPALQRGGVRATKISFQAGPNRELHIVDVTLKVE